MNNDWKLSLDLGKLAFTLPEAAEVASVGLSTLKAAIDRGDLPRRYPSTRPIILASDLERWLEGLPTTPPPRSAAGQRGPSGTRHGGRRARTVTLQQLEAQANSRGLMVEELILGRRPTM